MAEIVAAMASLAEACLNGVVYLSRSTVTRVSMMADVATFEDTHVVIFISSAPEDEKSIFSYELRTCLMC